MKDGPGSRKIRHLLHEDVVFMLGQGLDLWPEMFDSGSAGDKSVIALPSLGTLQITDAVLKPLLPVLKLLQLFLITLLLGTKLLQFGIGLIHNGYLQFYEIKKDRSAWIGKTVWVDINYPPEWYSRRLFHFGGFAGIAAEPRKGCSPLYGAERRKAAGHSSVTAASLAERTYGTAEAAPYISALLGHSDYVPL